MVTLEKVHPSSAVLSRLDQVINWAREHSIAYLGVDLACCGIEMLQTHGSRYDIERFGSMPQVSPHHADLMIVAGNVSYKMAEELKKLYDQMPGPKYVISMGSCANTGGMFSWEYSYATVSGVDKILPVDVFIPGCPPRPEALLHGLLKLKEKIRGEKVQIRNEYQEGGQSP